MHRTPRRVRALLVLLAAGCGPTKPAVPEFDMSAGYGPIEFKDDAPANAGVGSGAFPTRFVDADGHPVDLVRYRGQKKLVLVVLRGLARSEGGRVCPSCFAQALGMTANAAAFEERGAVVLFVFPGEGAGGFLQEFRAGARDERITPPQLLLDRHCEACDRLGIRDDLAKPSTYILDRQGNVVYAYVGETSTDRPSVKAVLAQLDRTK
ncbi:MAG: peroxiredoxin family protein [Gemmata sp.]